MTILGSGTSHGVPMIACDCAVCTSNDPCDKRTRPSAVFTLGEHNILVDAGPELRLQCIACGIRSIDAVLLTHHHADHVAGLDDLRRFNWLAGRPLDVYANHATLLRVRRMFDYCFTDDPHYASSKPQLVAHDVSAPFELLGQRVVPIPYLHGTLPVLGYRIGRMAYCTDVSHIPDESYALLRDLDVLVLGALRRRPHPTHFNLDQAVDQARRIGARRTFFTHIAHELLHAEVNAELPDGMALSHDGLVLIEE
ncbi:MAG: Phosphoribosyl 1,2-cyclic phosphate phosphodiesterase [Phycisphaerae bacterium]|nr:Phosphoribosyl 1,2-cyclic phosphate phosphodiesterase [Phycisphaerae bacterium]